MIARAGVIALLLVSLGLGPVSADSGAMRQKETLCEPCAPCDPFCASINGRRLDQGESLDGRHVPQNTERRLPNETYLLFDPPGSEPPADEGLSPAAPTGDHVQLSESGQSSRQPFFRSGEGELSAELQARLDQIIAKHQGKTNLRLNVIGHADSQPLSPTAKARYGDNYGLGLSRAKSAAAYLAQGLHLSADAVAVGSHGADLPLVDNATAQGMAQNRRVEVQIWYDPPSAAPSAPPTPQSSFPKPLRNCEEVLADRTRSPQAPYRISVDGVPLNGSGVVDPDIQRCTDLALERADIQVRYDALEETPWLNVSVFPNAALVDREVTFTSYSNYHFWIMRGEVRLFAPDASALDKPMAVLPLDDKGRARWTADSQAGEAVRYLLRVYDRENRFDETAPQILHIAKKTKPLGDEQPGPREELIGYGENRLTLRNIPVRGGAVTVNGANVAPGDQVRFLGKEIPVALNGKFAARQILPAGSHVVAVEVFDPKGNPVMRFARNLYIPDEDWFYVAIADLTAGQAHTNGPAALVTADDTHDSDETYVDGRLAFYLKGKIKGEWILTAAADTREQPVGNLFTNFDSKDPRYLLRRLDPDRYYPVYGDDSTTLEDAPTRGKFYVRLARGDSHVMWGNFQTAIPGSDLIQFSRGMYGANLKYRGDASTSFGQKNTQADFFAGDPGTLGAREQFRGTGGSLYYVKNMDVTSGSERLWTEIRDMDSGIVLKTALLSPGQDYEFDYLQGRILLTYPLPSTADDSQLVRAGSLAGHPVYLMVTYEYTPGISKVDNFTGGGRVSQWFKDKLLVGLTGYRQGDDATEQQLYGSDITYRFREGSYIKAEAAQSEGPGTAVDSSATGGFEFRSTEVADEKATAKRVETALDLADFSAIQSRVKAYWQEREKGYSSPGQATSEEIRQVGLDTAWDVTKTTRLSAKVDNKDANSQDNTVLSGSVRQEFNQNWALSAGVRHDDLSTHTPNASSTLSQDGARTDLAVQGEYTPDTNAKEPDWKAYGFGQTTVAISGNREENNRIGLGGKRRLNDRFALLGEASTGDGGLGGKVGGDWRTSDRSQLYLNYELSPDRTDSLYRGRQGTLTSGAKTRYSDSLSVYGEERYQNGDGPSGLIHAYGLDLAALDRWNFGFKGEHGDLQDPLVGDFSRTALTLSAGYTMGKTKYAGNIEWREDDGEVIGDRTTWLLRNSIGYQTTPEWRALGKLNFSVSDSSLGHAYDTDFTEAVLGYAYRPVDNDKLNALFKYTYFYNVPSPAASQARVSAEYAQRSHILAADAIYDLFAWLSVGGKYAYRWGEVSAPRNGPWFDSQAHLLIGRVDWHFVYEWDAVAEYRWLAVTTAEDRRAGFLLAIYRHINRNVKIGVGYNFTDFSDDLTDLSYDNQGFFFNVISVF
jgi:outer membrane protein OmpA-like peptidoglycan-associated protein